MDLFEPHYLGCPICNKARQGHGGYARSAHTPVGSNTYRGYGCGHEFSLYDALERDCHGFFGILGVYAHWFWGSKLTIKVGKLETLEVDVPADIELFAGFLTPSMAVGGPDVHYIPKFLSLKGPKIMISTVGLLNAKPDELGTEMPLEAMLMGYSAPEAETWKKISTKA